jgi:3-(3-hydroxy-phenyl)propionate hydroxylase
LTRLQAQFTGLDVLVIARHPKKAPFANTLVDQEGTCFNGYDAEPGSAYLVRPDRHVTARWKRLEASALNSAFKTALAEPR